ncbi:formyltransferase family protein, partial [uncultured Aquimarina sp.]|uniref:formyltransferase family protein n=1 Tax=uncultured Aquimarina sp. TaxID=575652 RepID=UPI002608DE79
MSKNIKLSCYIIGEGRLPLICCEILKSKNCFVLGIISSDKQVEEWAIKNNIPIISPTEDYAAVLFEQPFDLLFSINNPYILKQEVYTLSKKYTINYHDSLLPKYAGVYSTSWALFSLEKTHGISWHCINDIVDSGDILKYHVIDIEPGETAFSLNLKCFESAIEKFNELIDDLLKNTETIIKQDLSQRTYFDLYKRFPNANIITWDSDAKEIDAMVRALKFHHYPNALGLPKLYINNEFLIVLSTKIFYSLSNNPCGTITQINEDYIQVSCANNEIAISSVMTMDGKELLISEMVKEYKLKQNYRLKFLDEEKANIIANYYNTICRYEKYWKNKFVYFKPIFHPYSNVNILTKRLRSSNKIKFLFNKDSIQFLNTSSEMNESSDLILMAIVSYLARISGVQSFYFGFSEKDEFNLEINEFKSVFSEFVPFLAESIVNKSFVDVCETLFIELKAIRDNKTYNKDIFLRYPQLDEFKDLLIKGSLYPIKILVIDNINDYKKDLTSSLTFIILKKTLDVFCDFNITVFSEKKIDKIKKEILLFFKRIILNPNVPISTLSLLTDKERDYLLYEWNDTYRAYPTDRTLYDLFELQVERTPDSIALVYEDRSLTYSELNDLSNALAYYIRDEYSARVG